MTVAQLIAEFRRVLADGELPYLWSDEEVCLYLTEAANEACTRSSLIEDRLTSSVCALSTVAATDTYKINQAIHNVKRVTIDGVTLHETSVEELDQTRPGWEAQSGKPTMFMTEGGSINRLRLVPTPDKVYAVKLTVYRTPLVEMTADDLSAEPEIPARLHLQLMPWVYRCALLKQDAEVFDKARAAEYDGIFTASFGPRINANIKRKQRDKRPPVVAMGW